MLSNYPTVTLRAIISLSFLRLSLALPGKRQDVSAQTTFLYDKSCNGDQKSALTQSQTDALSFASAALEDIRELVHTVDQDDYYVDFDSQAAIEYFGPQKDNMQYRETILTTLYRAKITFRGLGWSDYWSGRYVDVYCSDTSDKECGETSPAYTTNDHTMKYPRITYCPPFFKNLTSHASMVDKIKADTSGDMKKNIRNLRSQATTVLHEWLHIDDHWKAVVCPGGCKDTKQMVGGTLLQTYKAGRAKLLASRDPQKAANTNDNYVYFAMSKWMEKKLGTYPQYPRVWDGSKSRKDNEANEDKEPGAPSSIQSWELEDGPDDGPDGGMSGATDPAPVSDYPDWYQPAITDLSTPTVPALNVPSPTQSPGSYPNVNNVTCTTGDDSPSWSDCASALTKLIQNPNDQGTQGSSQSVAVSPHPEYNFPPLIKPSS
ncbi:MAG: hypothetical protein Q9227_001352 [Pyrenula ochraceoflavens]